MNSTAPAIKPSEAGLSDEERQARKSGRFVSFAGLIYGSFSTNTHVVPEFERLPDGVLGKRRAA